MFDNFIRSLSSFQAGPGPLTPDALLSYVRPEPLQPCRTRLPTTSTHVERSSPLYQPILGVRASCCGHENQRRRPRGRGRGEHLVGVGLAHGLLLVLVDHSQDTCDRLAHNLAARPRKHTASASAHAFDHSRMAPYRARTGPFPIWRWKPLTGHPHPILTRHPHPIPSLLRLWRAHSQNQGMALSK